VARNRGVAVVPLKVAREHLKAMFDDPFELADVIMAYDHIDDVIVFNPDHGAWADMASYLHEHQHYYSTRELHHLVRHEIGHAMHFRAISSSPEDCHRIWYAESLDTEQMCIARKVSGRAMWNPKEFVAEVYAGLWAKMIYDVEVLALFDRLGGVRP
jgi:hypothetical protein